MKKVLTAIVTFIFGLCLISATVATASAASVKKVSNFKATATPIAVTLTWTKAGGAKGYEIQQKTGKKWKTVATIKKAKTTKYTVKNLNNKKTYQFRIRAVNGKKKSAYTSLKIKTGVQKIQGVTATSAGLKSAKLTWTMADVSGYEIQRKVGKKWKNVKTIKKAKTTSLTVKKLPAGEESTFRIRGYVNGKGKKYYGAYTTVKVKTAVIPMKNVSIKNASENSVTVGWAKLSGVSGYQVQKLQSGKWADVNMAVKSGTTQLTVGGLGAFENQQLRVRAYQKDGKKTFYNDWATVNAKTLMGSVSGVRASDITVSSAKITWNSAGGAAGYRVLNNGRQVADVRTNNAVIGIAAGSSNTVTVVPYNGSTTGNTSSAVSFTAPCAKVTGVKINSATEDSVSVSWNGVNGASSYQLQYSKNGGSWSTVTVYSTSYQVKDLGANSSYSFRVRALNKNGSTTQYGEFSDNAVATTKGLGSFTANSISWYPVDGAAYYEVEYYDCETLEWKVAASDITETSFVNDEICSDDTRLFKVNAYNGSNNNIYTSNVASAYLSNVTFDINDNIISASWSKYSASSSYQLRVRSRGMGYDGATTYDAKDSSRSVKTDRLAPGHIYDVVITSGSGKALATFALEASDLVVNDTDRSKTDQLLYLVEAVNRSKFDESATLIFNSKPYSLNEVTYMDFGFQGAESGLKAVAVNTLLELLFDTSKGDCEVKGGFIKCHDATAIDNVFASMEGNENAEKISKTENSSDTTYLFRNGECDNYSNVVLAELIQPNANKGSLAYLYNSGNDAAWKNGFEAVTTTSTAYGGYKIEATLKAETTPNYHKGLVPSVNPGDMGLGNMGEVKINNLVGKTTIVAEIDSDGRLTSYKVVSPYKYDMGVELSLSGEANLAGDDAETDALNTVMKLLEKLVIEMNIKAQGRIEYEYTFTRSGS